MSSPAAEPPIFIVGPGRSGTTLLRSLLSAHPRIGITPETHFFRWARDWMEPGADRMRNFDGFWSAYVASPRFANLDVSPERCRELMDDPKNPTTASVFGALLTAYGERVGKLRIGEKTPGHFRWLPELTTWFPDSHFIMMERDPRAVVASQLNTPWVKARLSEPGIAGTRTYSVAWYASDWHAAHEEILPLWKNDSRFLTVQYERVVKDAEGEVRAICDFLSEPFVPEMITGRSPETVPVPVVMDVMNQGDWRGWVEEHNAQTLRPVSEQSLNKWRDQLSESEVAVVEGRCWRGMLEAGYQPVTPEATARRAWANAKVLSRLGDVEAKARLGLHNVRIGARQLLNRLRGGR